MLLGNEAIGRALEYSPDSSVFYRTSHQKIFQAIVGLYNRNEPADMITVSEELRRLGHLESVDPSTLSEIMDLATTSKNIEAHLQIVHNKHVLRCLINECSRIQQECFVEMDEAGDILARAEQGIFKITDARVRKSVVPLKDLIKSTFAHIQSLFDRKVRITGVPSGFDDLDELTSGFQRGDLIIIAGRPSMGKSAFAVNIAENAATRHKVPAVIFSLEMSSAQLVLRMFCSQSEVSLGRVRSGRLSNEDFPRLVTGAGLLNEAPIFLDDSSALTVFEIGAKCRRLAAEKKLGIVIIDYLQLIRSTGRAENRVQELSQITRSLKALAKELDVPIVALSQLSRAVEQRHGQDKRPQLSDLRESGSLEQDSDVVLFVFREEYYKRDDPSLKGLAKIIIGKQRNGPIGEVNLTFLHECTKFVPYSPMIIPGEAEPSF